MEEWRGLSHWCNELGCSPAKATFCGFEFEVAEPKQNDPAAMLLDEESLLV